MEAITRMRSTLVAADGIPIDKVSTNLGGDLIAMPWLMKLLLEGRVYIGGMGVEGTDPDGIATLVEETPTWMLRANTGIVAVPLYVRLQMTTEGGAAPDAYLAYVNTGTATPIAYTSGTAAHVSNALGGERRGHQAQLEHTVTVGTHTATQDIVLWQSKDMPDDVLTVEAVGTGTPIEGVNGNMSTVNIPLYPHVPIALASGAFLAFYSVTGTTDSKWRPTFVWAELDETQVPS